MERADHQIKSGQIQSCDKACLPVGLVFSYRDWARKLNIN